MGAHKKTRSKPHHLYILKDPRDLQIKYVGVTHSVANRIRLRKYQSSFFDKDSINKWLFILKQLGHLPIIEVIKEYDNFDSAHKAEIFLISKLGDELLNIQHNV